MDEKKRSELIRTAWEIHGAVEEAYLCNPATRNAILTLSDQFLPHAELRKATEKL